jgi:hypothetical protein
MVQRQPTRCAIAFAGHVVGSEPHHSHVIDISMQHDLRSALAGRSSEDVDFASLLRVFVEASSLCYRCRYDIPFKFVMRCRDDPSW